MSEPKKGDKVEWNSHGQKVRGTVEGEVTSTAHARGHTAKATLRAPQYKVRSDRTGRTAIHKPEALHRVSGAGAPTAKKKQSG